MSKAFRVSIVPTLRFLATAALMTLAGCQTSGPPLPAPPPLALPSAAQTPEGAIHALDRLTFGARPGDLARIEAIGVDRWLALQMQPDRIAESSALVAALAAYPTLRQSDAALYERYVELRDNKTPEGQETRNHFTRDVQDAARDAKLLRAILSERQLQEVLVGFWFNHFNVYEGKGEDRLWMAGFEDEAIRPYVFGRFRDMLEATARHPAMLFYLDNWQNTAPGSHGAHGRQEGLNENYARELMELHTLGVDGGYSQQDVIELARILTGWGLNSHATHFGRGPNRTTIPADDSFQFDPDRHDNGEKHLLGVTIEPGGEREVEQALDLLAASPATARHLSFQLAQYFVADAPDPALVAAMTATYLRTQGNLSEVLRTLFESSQFWAASTRNAKVKTPFEFVVSAIRATGLQPNRLQPLQNALRQLGQPIYGYETPDGYKQVAAAWISPDAMAHRLSFATQLGNGYLRLVDDQPTAVAELSIRAAWGHPWSATTELAAQSVPPALRSAILLGSPDFMLR